VQIDVPNRVELIEAVVVASECLAGVASTLQLREGPRHSVLEELADVYPQGSSRIVTGA